MIDQPLQDGDGEPAKRQAHAARIIGRVFRRQEWQIPDAAWSEVPLMLYQIVVNPDSSKREITSASRTLISMSQANQQGVGVDARVNAQLGQIVDVPPEAPEDVDLERQEAFYEVVSIESKKEMLALAEEMGLTERLLGKQEIPTNGQQNGNGKPRQDGI